MLKKIDKRLNRQKVQRNEDAALLPNEEDGGGAKLTWWIWWPIDGWTHMKTQSGEKVYKCNQCDFASVGADNLRKHLKTPSGEKLFKCNQCNSASGQPGNLRTHLKTHF